MADKDAGIFEPRCSDCKMPLGAQHSPSCHRQGLVTETSDYRDRETPAEASGAEAGSGGDAGPQTEGEQRPAKLQAGVELPHADDNPWTATHLGKPKGPVGVCRICGCTAEKPCYEGCYWAGPDYCSECAEFTFMAAEYLLRAGTVKDKFALIWEEAAALSNDPAFTEADDNVPMIIAPDSRIVIP